MVGLKDIIRRLHEVGDKEKVFFKEKKFGVIANNSLGVYQKDLKQIAIEIGKNSPLAIELFDTGIYEARILCSKIFDPKDVTPKLMDKWVKTFENWEICDSFCMGLFAKCQWAVPKVFEWSLREREFEKRAGFAIIAAYCMADKKVENEVFENFLPIIKREAEDERVYVKKSVNWALRNIGKRNIDLNRAAINLAHELLMIDNVAAKWIAKDAIRELENGNVKILDYPRSIYRKVTE